MQNERDILINAFENEMRHYFPNWNAIIEANNIAPETFGQRLRKLRESRGLTQVEMGERLSCGKQNISKIENGKNKNIPVKKLDDLSDLFSVSVAYLLGLDDDDSLYFDKSQYYFWEYPDNKYEFVKKDVLNKPLIYPMETWGNSLENMLKTVIEGLRTDYDLTQFLHLFFTAKKTKQKKIRNIVIAIKKIL